MIDVEWKDLYYQDSVDKQLIISCDNLTIGNDDIDSESMVISESLCSKGNLRFGSCEASSFKIRIRNHVKPLSGKKIVVNQMLSHNAANAIYLGAYKVVSDVPDAGRNYRDITAYDAMYDIINADVAEWYNNLAFPMTQRAFRDSFFDYFEITQVDTILVNDEMTVEKTINPNELSGKTVVTAICELNGCFGHINRNGKFAYILLETDIGGLYPADTLYPSNTLFPMDTKSEKISKSKYIKCSYEDYLVKKITKLQIRQEENDIGAIAGTGDNCYIIEDNFLVYGKNADDLATLANNLYNVISQIPQYRPYECTAVGNPCIEVGDAISISGRYEIVESYVLQRTLKGIQALRDTYSAEGEEYCTVKVNGVNKAITQLRGKTNTLSRTVEETRLTISDLENNLQAQITINANGLQTKVSKDNVVSEINQSAEKITIQASKIDLQGLVSATEFTSKYATIGSLNAQKARIDNIEANYISAGTVAANYATIGSLNAVNASVSGKLDANQFTAANISAMNITVQSANVSGGFNASKITSGTISTDRLNVGAIASRFSSANNITVGALNAQSVVSVSINVSTGASILGHTISWKSANVNGNTIHYLGY